MPAGGVRSAMDLFDFEKSAKLKHPNKHIIHFRGINAYIYCSWIDREINGCWEAWHKFDHDPFYNCSHLYLVW